MASKNMSIDDYIHPLHINGMNGRVLHMPAPKDSNREILVIYGHHSTLERWWGLAQNFNEMGAVTMPDLPGFGGMDSFYSIGQNASIDAYADYMAAYVKMRYKRKKVNIVGISFGFLVAARMLQKYPELCKRVDFLVSAVGFMHHDNFSFSSKRRRLYLMGARIFSLPPMPFIFRYVFLNRHVLRLAYARTHNAKHKFKKAGSDQALFEKMMDMEIVLWQKNDARTYMKTSRELLQVDNTTTKIDLPVWHVHAEKDNYFDNDIVEQQMRVVFSEFHGAEVPSDTHAPSVIADKQESSVLIPRKLRTALRKSR